MFYVPRTYGAMEGKPPEFFSFGDPRGEEGRKALESMNSHHSELGDWAVSLIPVNFTPKSILDVGCGGGMFLKKLGEWFPSALLYGADLSEEACKLSSEVNAETIAEGRCRIDRASVDNLPYPDGTFDLITAVETYFFWPNLKESLEELKRVLKDGGVLMIVSEQYPHPLFDERNRNRAERTGFVLVKNEEMESMLESMNLKTEVHTLADKNWVCFRAVKYGDTA